MRTTGIIAEYNPFHSGHQYHIEETRRKTGADFLITAISGDFVQRGAPAILDKYERTRMALEGGADLVLELPVTAAVSSAEGFASGGVCLFEKLGVTDAISFGCEDVCSDSLFTRTARILAEEPGEYKPKLASCLKQGMSFPKARETALLSCMEPENGQESEQVSRLISSPNNILGLEYQKAILKYGSRIEVCRICRRGSGYNSAELSSSLSSATAIRNHLLNREIPPRKQAADLNGQVPSRILPNLLAAGRENRFLRENDFSDLLFYVIQEKKDMLDCFGSPNSGLAWRTANHLENFESWEQFILLVKSKNQTYTGISRYFTQILLNIRREDLLLAQRYQYSPYARILGFRRSAAPLLKEIRAKSRIPVLMQLAGDSAGLDADCRRLLQLDVSAAALYNRILFSKSGCRLKSDYRHPLILL